MIRAEGMEAVVKEVLPPVENLREEYGLHRGSKLRGMIKTAKEQKRRAKERGTKLKPGSSTSSSNPLPSLNGDHPPATLYFLPCKCSTSVCIPGEKEIYLPSLRNRLAFESGIGSRRLLNRLLPSVYISSPERPSSSSNHHLESLRLLAPPTSSRSKSLWSYSLHPVVELRPPSFLPSLRSTRCPLASSPWDHLHQLAF